MEFQDKFCWLEYATILRNGKMIRNKFFRTDDHDALKLWRIQFDNTDIFTSVCRYCEPRRESSFIAPMFFDLDCDNNLEQARKDAIGLCQLLEEKAKVPRDSLGLFFSGSKGFHIEVPLEIFEPEPSPYMLKLYRRMAIKAIEVGIKTIDVGVYSQGRLWRVAGSINSKKNLYKIPLTFKELSQMDLTEIVELAKNPRSDESFALSAFCQDTADWYCRAVGVLEKKSKSTPVNRQMNLDFKRGWRMVPCVKAIEEDAVLSDGIRHATYIELSRYFAFLGMHPMEILERILKINSRNPIKDQGAIERAVKWGCEHPGFGGCYKGNFMNYCRKKICFYEELKNRANGKTTKTTGGAR